MTVFSPVKTTVVASETSVRVRHALARLGPLLGLALMCGLLAVLHPRFLEGANLVNVARQVSIQAIIGAGMTVVILTGGIDLSVGSVLAFSGAIAARLAADGLPVSVVLVGALAVGVTCGVLNGILVAYGRIAPFIATLGSMTAVRGLTLAFTGGRPITGLGEGFRALGSEWAPILIMICVYAVVWAFLGHTRAGRYIYAVGSNEEAAWVSGIAVRKIRLLAYSLSGLTAALGGVVLAARLNSAQPTAGTGFELDAIAAVVLGGTGLSGGAGGVGGTLVGALIIGVVNNGLNLINVSSFYQQVVKGLVILIAVLLDRGRR
ncbi:ribose ABC transporter permease [Thermaerobacter sp. FW80]|uniref:ABC transporter permease n=1 Tax=Thermaerobacter sp. FW80 TaxID=2546351 RepID=UPI001074A1E0|nr:ribose ABC transporter permease [Thermaerobacter sp. FW80]QBS37361.1 ribose ABC transporter permease [Thermaerobacter sp. FW80]